MVSSSKRQCLQAGSWSFLILLRCLLSMQCPVLSWKILLSSLLVRDFSGLSFIGFLMKCCMNLPVLPCLQSSTQRFCPNSLINVFADCSEVSRSGWFLEQASFAKMSAFSFPGRLLCPGIH